MTDTRRKDMDRISNINAKMWSIFNEYGGYEYNDEMYYQLVGFRESLLECETDEDYSYMLEEALDTMKYFNWVVEYKQLMDREPPQIYG